MCSTASRAQRELLWVNESTRGTRRLSVRRDVHAPNTNTLHSKLHSLAQTHTPNTIKSRCVNRTNPPEIPSPPPKCTKKPQSAPHTTCVCFKFRGFHFRPGGGTFLCAWSFWCVCVRLMRPLPSVWLHNNRERDSGTPRWKPEIQPSSAARLCKRQHTRRDFVGSTCLCSLVKSI